MGGSDLSNTVGYTALRAVLNVRARQSPDSEDAFRYTEGRGLYLKAKVDNKFRASATAPVGSLKFTQRLGRMIGYSAEHRGQKYSAVFDVVRDSINRQFPDVKVQGMPLGDAVIQAVKRSKQHNKKDPNIITPADVKEIDRQLGMNLSYAVGMPNQQTYKSDPAMHGVYKSLSRELLSSGLEANEDVSESDLKSDMRLASHIQEETTQFVKKTLPMEFVGAVTSDVARAHPELDQAAVRKLVMNRLENVSPNALTILNDDKPPTVTDLREAVASLESAGIDAADTKFMLRKLEALSKLPNRVKPARHDLHRLDASVQKEMDKIDVEIHVLSARVTVDRSRLDAMLENGRSPETDALSDRIDATEDSIKSASALKEEFQSLLKDYRQALDSYKSIAERHGVGSMGQGQELVQRLGDIAQRAAGLSQRYPASRQQAMEMVGDRAEINPRLGYGAAPAQMASDFFELGQCLRKVTASMHDLSTTLADLTGADSAQASAQFVDLAADTAQITQDDDDAMLRSLRTKTTSPSFIYSKTKMEPHGLGACFASYNKACAEIAGPSPRNDAEKRTRLTLIGKAIDMNDRMLTLLPKTIRQMAPYPSGFTPKDKAHIQKVQVQLQKNELNPQVETQTATLIDQRDALLRLKLRLEMELRPEPDNAQPSLVEEEPLGPPLDQALDQAIDLDSQHLESAEREDAVPRGVRIAVEEDKAEAPIHHAQPAPYEPSQFVKDVRSCRHRFQAMFGELNQVFGNNPDDLRTSLKSTLETLTQRTAAYRGTRSQENAINADIAQINGLASQLMNASHGGDESEALSDLLQMTSDLTEYLLNPSARQRSRIPSISDADSRRGSAQGVEQQGAEPQGAEPQGAKPQGVEPQGVEPQGAEPKGAKPRGNANLDDNVAADAPVDMDQPAQDDRQVQAQHAPANGPSEPAAGADPDPIGPSAESAPTPPSLSRGPRIVQEPVEDEFPDPVETFSVDAPTYPSPPLGQDILGQPMQEDFSDAATSFSGSAPTSPSPSPSPSPSLDQDVPEPDAADVAHDEIDAASDDNLASVSDDPVTEPSERLSDASGKYGAFRRGGDMFNSIMDEVLKDEDARSLKIRGPDGKEATLEELIGTTVDRRIDNTHQRLGSLQDLSNARVLRETFDAVRVALDIAQNNSPNDDSLVERLDDAKQQLSDLRKRFSATF